MLGSPYLNLSKDKLLSIRFEVSIEDARLIKNVSGLVQINRILLGNAINVIANELRTLGIDHYSPDNSDRLASIIARRFTSNPSHPGSINDVPKGSSGVCNTTPYPENVSPKPKGRGRKRNTQEEGGGDTGA